MSILPFTIAVLVTGGVYLVLHASMVRVAFGIALLGHAGNLVLLAAGVSAWRMEPLAGRTAPDLGADPLPMAFVLTAIVITLAVTVYMLALAAVGHDDDTRNLQDTGEAHRE